MVALSLNNPGNFHWNAVITIFYKFITYLRYLQLRGIERVVLIWFNLITSEQIIKKFIKTMYYPFNVVIYYLQCWTHSYIHFINECIRNIRVAMCRLFKFKGDDNLTFEVFWFQTLWNVDRVTQSKTKSSYENTQSKIKQLFIKLVSKILAVFVS